MNYTVELLVNSDRDVLEYYRLAVERWREIWKQPEASSLRSLASMLADEETWFQQNCGGPFVGQEIMVVSGFGLLYSTQDGFADRIERARLLDSAFQQSFCSLEVTRVARDVVESYEIRVERVA